MTPTAPSVILSGITARVTRSARDAYERAHCGGLTHLELVAFHTSISPEFIAMSADRETARQHLLSVTVPEGVDAALAEADRRSLAGMDLAHAYTSVAEDIATRRWDPR